MSADLPPETEPSPEFWAMSGRAPVTACVRLARTLGRMSLDHPLRGGALLSLGTALFWLSATRPPREVLDEVMAVLSAERDPCHPELAGVVRGLVLVLRATGADEAAGIRQLRRAVHGLGAKHPLRRMVMAVLGIRLLRRAAAAGDLTAAEQADRCLATAERELGTAWAGPGAPAFRVPRADGLVVRARLSGDVTLADRAIARLQSDLARLPAADPWTPRALRILGEAWRLRGELLGREEDLRRGHELVIAAGAAVLPGHPDATRLITAAALAHAALADLTGDPDLRAASVDVLVRAADQTGLPAEEHVELLLRLAAALAARGGPTDAEHRLARLEQARALLARLPGHPLGARVRAEPGDVA